MWKSRLLGKEGINNSVLLLAEKMHDYAPTNILLVNYRQKLCQIDRLEYYPDEDGKVLFMAKKKWEDCSYSVGEMLEFIEKYGHLIKDLKFQAYDLSEQSLVNFSETCDVAGVVWYTHLIVGDGSDTMKLPLLPKQSLYNPNIGIFVG